MKASDVAMEPPLATATLMAAHDKKRSRQVDWRKTKISIGGFFGRDNDPLRELSRVERHDRRSDGRAVAFDEDAVELADLLDAVMTRKKHRSYINDGACGKACDFRHGRSRAQVMGDAMRRNGSLGAHRSFGC